MQTSKEEEGSGAPGAAVTPKVSVLIPAYNYAGFIGEAVESALGQRYPGEIECIVVDDGSTDGTWDVLAPYRGRGVRVLRQANRGQAAALNRAFRVSTGEIVCFLDADDVWAPEKVATVVDVMTREPEVGLVHHAVRVIGPDGAVFPSFPDKGTKAEGDVARTMWRTLLRWRFSPFSTLCLRRTVAQLVFPLLTSMRGNADDLIAPAASLLAPVAYVPRQLVLYRVHGRNMWAAEELARCLGNDLPGPSSRGAEGGRDPKDVNGLPPAVRHCRLLEEKARQANLVLRRAGLRGRFSPWADWTYLKTVGQEDPWRSLGRAVNASWELKGLPLWERAGIAFRLVRRTVKKRVREAGSTSAALGIGGRSRDVG